MSSSSIHVSFLNTKVDFAVNEGISYVDADGVPHDKFWDEVAQGEWEPETFAALDRFLKPDHVFLDLGAWVGAVTLYAASICKFVHSFEPDSIAFQRLTENLLLNADLKTRIAAHNVAVSDNSKGLRLYTAELGNSETSIFAVHERAGQQRPVSSEIDVPTVDFLTLVQTLGRSNPLFIKCDIEGAEYKIFDERFSELPTKPTVLLAQHPENINILDDAEATQLARKQKSLEIMLALKEYSEFFYWLEGKWKALSREEMFSLQMTSEEVINPVIAYR